ncbi:MAG: AlpA family transcriptional regulator [Gammaproteobacteria bacterium]|nr:AlpA family transcriptional regulator [Gammaproteobacteria bacterium]
MATTFLRLPAVKARTGLSRSSLYLRISEGTFPKPISLGARAVGWNESDIEIWMQQRIEETRAKEAGK